MDYKCVRVSVEEGVGLIEFIRPKEMNSFISIQYGEVTRALQELDKDPRCVVAVITGSGRYYSSGHDLRSFKEFFGSEDIPAAIAKSTRSQALPLVDAFIDFSKPLICGVNGGCIGIACTSAALCDIIYVAESAFFKVPFMEHSFCAEGCSSSTFPQLLGTSRANEMLLLGEPLNATDAVKTGFAAAVFPNESFRDEVMKRAKKMAKYSKDSLCVTKALVRTEQVKNHLREVNRRELEELIKRFQSDDVFESMARFMMNQQAKSKGKKGEKPNHIDTPLLSSISSKL